MHWLTFLVHIYIRLELEEERDTLKAKCLRSQSSIAELRTQLQQEKNGTYVYASIIVMYTLHMFCTCDVYTAHVYHIILYCMAMYCCSCSFKTLKGSYQLLLELRNLQTQLHRSCMSFNRRWTIICIHDHGCSPLFIQVSELEGVISELKIEKTTLESQHR